MSGLAGATTGDGYKSSKGLPWHRTKDDSWYRLFPVLNNLGMSKYFFSYYNHNWYCPTDSALNKNFACPLKNKIGDNSMGTYCPACEVFGPLEAAYKAAVESVVAQGHPEKDAKVACKAHMEHAGNFRPRWNAAAPSIKRADNVFGWLRMSGLLMSHLEKKATLVFGDKDLGINAILHPATGFDIHLSHPTRTTWNVEKAELPTPLFSQGAETLQAVVDKWCNELSEDLVTSKAKGTPSKIEKMHKWHSTPQEMYEATAIWCQRLNVALPTAPSGAQTASAPVQVPANIAPAVAPAIAQMYPAQPAVAPAMAPMAATVPLVPGQPPAGFVNPGQPVVAQMYPAQPAVAPVPLIPGQVPLIPGAVAQPLGVPLAPAVAPPMVADPNSTVPF